MTPEELVAGAVQRARDAIAKGERAYRPALPERFRLAWGLTDQEARVLWACMERAWDSRDELATHIHGKEVKATYRRDRSRSISASLSRARAKLRQHGVHTNDPSNCPRKGLDQIFLGGGRKWI